MMMDNEKPRGAVCLLAALAAVSVSTALRAEAPDQPLPPPEYSFDLSSPTVNASIVFAADILELAFPYPVPFMPALGLGLVFPEDDVDGLSGSNASIAGEIPFHLLFSVSRTSTGGAAPDPDFVALGIPYNAADQTERGHAAGDQFLSTDRFDQSGPIVPGSENRRRNHFLTRNNFDEGGTDFSALPPTHADTVVEPGTLQDRVDAMGRLDRDEAGALQTAFFSLTTESPSAWLLGQAFGDGVASGATIYVAGPFDVDFGPCCLENGDCLEVGFEDCAAVAGIWLGPGSDCATCEAFNPVGACCLIEGPCEQTFMLQCDVIGGLWIGPDSDCGWCDEMMLGACCLGGDYCLPMTLPPCENAGGIWLGPGTSCDYCGEMTAIGACCFPVGCEEMSGEDCFILGGFFLGPDMPCSICNAIPVTGACCFGDGACAEMDAEECQNIGGEFTGPGGTCNACELIEPMLGACCFADVCDLLLPDECFAAGGFWMGPGTRCEQCPAAPSPPPPDQPEKPSRKKKKPAGKQTKPVSEPLGPAGNPSGEEGACCLPDGRCVPLPELLCLASGGSWLGEGSDCKACGSPEPTLLQVTVYAHWWDLGLMPEDDIDACVVIDRNENGIYDADDVLLFSLRPASISLSFWSWSAADVLIATPGALPTVFVAADDLGLSPETGDLDALELLPMTTVLGKIQVHGIQE